MRATVEPFHSRQYERKGFFGSKTVTEQGHFLKISIELTPSEQAVIDSQKLWHTVIHQVPNIHYPRQIEIYRTNLADYRHDISRPYKLDLIRLTAKEPIEPSKTIPITIAELCRPDGVTLDFATTLDVKNEMEELRLKALPRLKDLIQYNQSPPTKQTFDL
jgi:hypothetical protein